MSRATAGTLIGVVFLLVGLGLVGLAVAPVIIGMLEVPHVHADVSLTVLFVGLATAIFGALLIPDAGAKSALTVIVATAGPYLPTFGRRKTDPPAGGAP